jgi:hypothetical protein
MNIDFVKQTCKIGQGAVCCRYLGADGGGFDCLKLTSLRAYLDERVALGTITARGDNCEGLHARGEAVAP